MKYDLGTVDIPTIVANSGSGYPTFVLDFDSPPDVRIGEEYCTCYSPLSASLDVGYFLALWVEGNRLHVAPRSGWTPTNGHVLAAKGWR